MMQPLLMIQTVLLIYILCTANLPFLHFIKTFENETEDCLYVQLFGYSAMFFFVLF